MKDASPSWARRLLFVRGANNERVMFARRTCAYRYDDGRSCKAAPLRDSDFCLWHDPEHAEQVAESRRLGGSRRRREVTLSGVYDLESVITVRDIQRLVEIAVMDTLALENSVQRNRTLAYLAQTALRTIEVGEQEERIRTLEAALLSQTARQVPIFDLDAHDDDIVSTMDFSLDS